MEASTDTLRADVSLMRFASQVELQEADDSWEGSWLLSEAGISAAAADDELKAELRAWQTRLTKERSCVLGTPIFVRGLQRLYIRTLAQAWGQIRQATVARVPLWNAGDACVGSWLCSEASDSEISSVAADEELKAELCARQSRLTKERS